MELQVAGKPGQTATKSHLNRNAAAHGTALTSNWGLRMLLGRSLHYKELARADCRGAEPCTEVLNPMEEPNHHTWRQRCKSQTQISPTLLVSHYFQLAGHLAGSLGCSFSSQFPCCIQGLPRQHVSQPLHWLHEAGAQPGRTRSPNRLLQAQRHRAEARPQPTSPRTLPAVPPVTTSHSCKQIHLVTSSTLILQYKVIPISSCCPGASPL